MAKVECEVCSRSFSGQIALADHKRAKRHFATKILRPILRQTQPPPFPSPPPPPPIFSANDFPPLKPSQSDSAPTTDEAQNREQNGGEISGDEHIGDRLPEAHFRLYLGEKIGLEEGECVEFKQSFDAYVLYPDRLRRTLNSFLNTKGGTVYLGVRDDGIICGVLHTSVTIDKLRLWVDQTQHHHFSPPVSTIQVKVFKLTSGLAVWAICVPARKPPFAPVLFEKQAFYRLNASTVSQTEDALVDIDRKQAEMVHNLQAAAKKCVQLAERAHDLQTKLDLATEERDSLANQIQLLIKENEAKESEHLKKIESLSADLKKLTEQHETLGAMTRSLVNRFNTK